MSDKALTRIFMAIVAGIFATLMFLTWHLEYTEARTGENVCETNVRSCE